MKPNPDAVLEHFRRIDPEKRCSDEPYALRSPAEIKLRRSLLTDHHMKPLAEWVARIRLRVGSAHHIPDLDPADGGVNAKILLLMEAPGPKAIQSGFVSRNNPDPTARNICDLLDEADTCRRLTALWNIVPWYVGDGRAIRPVNGQDIHSAVPCLGDLLSIMSQIRVIVLVGRKAQQILSFAPKILRGYDVVSAWHPSGRVLNRWPERRSEIVEVLRTAKRLATDAA